jgi:hypothetical protein
MAIKLVKGFSESYKMYCGTSSSIVKDTIVCRNVAGGAGAAAIIPATAALLSVNLAGVAVNTPAATDEYVDVIPPMGQLWEIDTTSNTLSTHLNKPNDLTDAATLANSTTISTAATQFFVSTEMVGATANKKMRGYLLGGNIPKALS